ncbi:Stage III sporulation protein AF [Lentibacillus sp. JNUCC-1]|uniref:stage III sporulation protein AF n=1 Tax=Lentibacillus sp. JNUCC-1 TaxID=2654513 RepID=UPI0012E76198|nr:stage III sporulation protein AF [Lentibacillus sp. JNUCC-1]MUV39673.1 Stage III sporulation protein AF [Lentibacillus sp. JNUCC-1]
MDAIIQWVSQIIIFILLATIIDLLIPQTGLKKYINLVVGLILILIFLKPVFHIFNMDIQEALSRSYKQIEQQEINLVESEKKMEFQKKDIQASQDAYILEQMASRLKELADPPLRNGVHYEVADIKFEFKGGTEMTLENMETLIVFVKPSESQEGVVKQVNEIEISTNDEHIQEESLPSDEIKDILQSTWEIETDRLEIVWGGGIN